MATESRLDAPPLTPAATGGPPDVGQPDLELALRDDPTSFTFFQAVRLLERLRPEREPVGRFANPADEIVRFGTHTAIAFPASDIQSLTLGDTVPAGDAGDVGRTGQARMAVNFFGLTGPSGVLPLVYSTHVRDREREHDATLHAFLDLFSHRLLSLFYRAWEKYHFAVAHERDQRDRLTEHLRDLLGLGTPGLQERLAVPDEALIFYTGLLALPGRPVTALQHLLADYFGVPVEIEQFVGAWYPLDTGTQCSLGAERDASDQLGLGAVAGDEIWDQQSRVRVRIGPLTRAQYDQFLPDGDAYEPLRSLTHFFGGGQIDYEVQLVLARDEVPACVLGEERGAMPLGWCTWMKTRPFARDPDETTLTL